MNYYRHTILKCLQGSYQCEAFYQLFRVLAHRCNHYEKLSSKMGTHMPQPKPIDIKTFVSIESHTEIKWVTLINVLFLIKSIYTRTYRAIHIHIYVGFIKFASIYKLFHLCTETKSTYFKLQFYHSAGIRSTHTSSSVCMMN